MKDVVMRKIQQKYLQIFMRDLIILTSQEILSHIQEVLIYSQDILDIQDNTNKI